MENGIAMRSASRCFPAILVLAMAAATVGTLGGIAYSTGKSLDAELVFFEPNRAPTIDEAMLLCPVEYALRSTEENDVIFLGGSSCRCGIDPTRLPGLKSYNLASNVGLAPDGIYVTAKAYLLRHRHLRVVVLVLSPVTFDFQTDDQWRVGLTTRFVASYGPRVGMVPPFAADSEAFVKRGFVEIMSPGKPDLRDLPLTGDDLNTYRTFNNAFLACRGYFGMPGERRKEFQLGEQYPFKIGEDWNALILKLGADCEARAARLIVRVTPISVNLSRWRDFTSLNDWGRRLEATDPQITVPQPALLVYEQRFMWDNIHLNAAGVEKFMPVVSKDVEAVLKKK
jgi:hypothetical protein